jgi:hypothetical protein
MMNKVYKTFILFLVLAIAVQLCAATSEEEPTGLRGLTEQNHRELWVRCKCSTPWWYVVCIPYFLAKCT